MREERPAAVDAAQGRGVDPAVVVELVRATIARSPYPVLGIGIGTPASWTGTAPFARPPTSGGPTCRCAISWPTRPVFPCSSRTTRCRDPGRGSAPHRAARTWSSCTSVVASDAASSPAATGSPAPSRAGEIGHVTVGTDGGEDCPCGKQGCLETWLSTASQGGLDGPDGRDVVEIGGERLGVALAPIVAALDPSPSRPRRSEELLAPVLPVLERTLSERLLANPTSPSPSGLPRRRRTSSCVARRRTGPLGPARGRLTPLPRCTRAVRPHRPKRKTE